MRFQSYRSGQFPRQLHLPTLNGLKRQERITVFSCFMGRPWSAVSCEFTIYIYLTIRYLLFISQVPCPCSTLTKICQTLSFKPSIPL